ncbi:unnamed protein product [Dovyalis caffra]|uniref:Peptidase M24 domain-containing protein n=1 Tax=Dovyalis caffra TaxID=77055 RepID=A0AAV1RMJ9_9ROSI|nr:unnamed protein product [Dovyalis caffra]
MTMMILFRPKSSHPSSSASAVLKFLLQQQMGISTFKSSNHNFCHGYFWSLNHLVDLDGLGLKCEILCADYKLVGHIALDQTMFPENTPVFVLDVLAHSSLWKTGLDYQHGTGHGVGAALNVHEGPQSISFRYRNMAPLQKGMIVSNEPGYYEGHAFGIRIEVRIFAIRAFTCLQLLKIKIAAIICWLTLTTKANAMLRSPDKVITGPERTDSHACTAGAFRQFATRIGNTNAGFVSGIEKFPLKV